MRPFCASERDLISVGDIKQFAYCPRIPYFTRCLGLKPPPTFLMRRGEDEEANFGRKQKRHTVSRFNLNSGTRYRMAVLSSEKLRLTGIVDLIIEGDSEIVVVDFKSAKNTGSENHMIQLGAYALLAEERFRKPCGRGYLFYAENKKWVEILLTEGLREKVLSTIKGLEEVIRSRVIPPPTEQIEKCRNCEFLNFCGDRW